MKCNFPRRLVATIHLLILAVPAVGFGQPPAGELRVARLVKQLGSNDFSDRQRADQELARLGPDSRSQLQEALRSDDPEVRLRAEKLLEQFESTRLWSASRVDFRGTQQPASSAMAALAQQTGNSLLLGSQYSVFADARLDLDYRGWTYWEAVDDLCRKSGNRVRHQHDSRAAGFVVSAGAPGSNPLAYSGPVRAQITSARRAFTEDLDYAEGKASLVHTFQINLQMIWEDRFRLMSYATQPQIVEAVTDTGIHVPAVKTNASDWNLAGKTNRQVNCTLKLVPPPTAAKSLSRLTLAWGVVAVGDPATLRIVNLQEPGQYHQDDLALQISKIERFSDGGYEIHLVAARDLPVPIPHEILFHENHVELVDQDGQTFRLQNESHQLTRKGVELKLRFAAASQGSQANELRFTYPRLRARRDLEIVFRDVSLPAQRPE